MKKRIEALKLLELLKGNGWYFASGPNQPFFEVTNSPMPLHLAEKKLGKLTMQIKLPTPYLKQDELWISRSLFTDLTEMVGSSDDGELIESVTTFCLGTNKERMAEVKNQIHQHAIRIAEKQNPSDMSSEQLAEFKKEVTRPEDVPDILGIFICPTNLAQSSLAGLK